MFTAIHSGEYHPAWEGENFDFDVEHDPREFDAKNLRIPRTGHRGIRGISTVARGMRGGLVVRGGGLHDSGVVRSGADERMRRSAFGAGGKGWEGGKNGEISRDVKSGLDGSKGGMEGIRGGSAPLGRQLSGETAEAGERLGESIRMAVRGDKRGPTK